MLKPRILVTGAPGKTGSVVVAELLHIIGLTQWLSSPSHPALMTRQFWLVDRLFMQSEAP